MIATSAITTHRNVKAAYAYLREQVGSEFDEELPF